jgi:hypothetical protein
MWIRDPNRMTHCPGMPRLEQRTTEDVGKQVSMRGLCTRRWQYKQPRIGTLNSKQVILPFYLGNLHLVYSWRCSLTA